MEKDKLIDWLREDLSTVKTDVKDINNKIDKLLQFKWQIVGGSIVVSFIVGVIIQVLIAAYGRQ